MSRIEVTEKIIATKVTKGIKWSDVAAKVGLSKEWVTAACLGQMTLTADQADVVGGIFGLSEDEKKWLTVVTYKGSLPTSVPTDPLIYRFYELVSVYGTTFKELIHEEFGDGIMSAIVCYSAGPYGGVRAAMQLRALLPEVGLSSIPSLQPIPYVGKSLSVEGIALTQDLAGKSGQFFDEFEWYLSAMRTQRLKGVPY